MKIHTSSSSPAETIGAMPTWPRILAGAGANAEVGWGREVEALRARELSLVAHLLAAVLLLFPVFNNLVSKTPNKQYDDSLGKIIFPGMPREKVPGPKQKPQGGGGGGEHSAVPARQGGPTIFDWQPKAPPTIVRNTNPKLAVDAALVGPPEILVPLTSVIGDPLSRFLTDSQGSGSDGGFGKGKGGGIGDDEGSGIGRGKKWGYGGEGVPQRPGWDGVGYPECVYCPTPSFSEEARKSKLQGSVTLHIVVGTDGRAANLRVVRGLGMGLDERAMEAVRGWRFKPALGPGGKPVPTEVLIEVTFRLL